MGPDQLSSEMKKKKNTMFLYDGMRNETRYFCNYNFHYVKFTLHFVSFCLQFSFLISGLETGLNTQKPHAEAYCFRLIFNISQLVYRASKEIRQLLWFSLYYSLRLAE